MKNVIKMVCWKLHMVAPFFSTKLMISPYPSRSSCSKRGSFRYSIIISTISTSNILAISSGTLRLWSYWRPLIGLVTFGN